MKYLILGCGPAGIAAAKSIRKAKSDAEIVIAGDELESPYLRPLLPDFILGEMDEESVLDPQGKDLYDKRVKVYQGKRAARLEMGSRKVVFGDGTEEPYDRLLIATGGKPSVPAPLQRKSDAILSFDSLGDARKIRERSKVPGAAVVYGPGYLAIEACRALRKTKKGVVWIRPDLPRHGYPISGELEASILDDVRNRGAKIKDGDDVVRAYEGEAGALVLLTREGGEIHCAMVVVATERVPAIGFLKGSGVMTETGVLVDDFLRTSAPDVYAAGDCAEFVADRAKGKSLINFGWRSAIKQGKLAGENMGGGNERFGKAAEDFFWVLFGHPLSERSK